MWKSLKGKQVKAKRVMSVFRRAFVAHFLQGTPGEDEREELEFQREDEKEEVSPAGSDLGWK